MDTDVTDKYIAKMALILSFRRNVVQTFFFNRFTEKVDKLDKASYISGMNTRTQKNDSISITS